MQSQGTDHLFWGIMHTGVLSGSAMGFFLFMKRQSLVLQVLLTGAGTGFLKGICLYPLTHLIGFFKGHSLSDGLANLDGVWQPTSCPSSPATQVLLWIQAPAATDVVIEQLAFSRHKRPGLIRFD
jgi:hypothetical protein